MFIVLLTMVFLAEAASISGIVITYFIWCIGIAIARQHFIQVLNMGM